MSAFGGAAWAEVIRTSQAFDAVKAAGNAPGSQAYYDAETRWLDALSVWAGARTPGRSSSGRSSSGRLSSWTRQSDGTYLLSDGRIVSYDVSAGAVRIVERGNPPMGGPREQIVQVTPGGQQYVLIGLYTDPERARGVQMLQEGTPAQRAAAELRVAQLRAQARTRGLNAAEAAELNDLTRALAGQTTLTLGLTGGGVYTGARARVVQRAADGTEYILAVGQQRTLGASVSGIVPRTAAELQALMAGYRQEEQRLLAEIQSLRARIAAVESGAADPGASHFLAIGGAARQ